MKKLHFLFFVLFLINLKLSGQQMISASDSLKYSYCEVFTKEVGMSGKVTVEINYGQTSKPFSETSYKSPVFTPVFSAIVDALNYMGKSGWEVIQVYAVLTGPSSLATYSYHYLLKKRLQ